MLRRSMKHLPAVVTQQTTQCRYKNPRETLMRGLRARVRHDTRRERHSESPQVFGTRSVAAKLLRFETPIRRNEWRRNVIPDQVATVTTGC
jgi:hypothetical protein